MQPWFLMYVTKEGSVCVWGGIHDQRQPGCEDKSYPQQRAAQQVLFCFCKYLNNTGFPQIAVQHAQSHHNYDSLVKYLSGAHILKKTTPDSPSHGKTWSLLFSS